VLAIENRAYTFPWTRGNFVDSLAAGYHTLVLFDSLAGVVGYYVAMAGVDEMHLLNLTVAPAWQGQGLASRLLDALDDQCRRLALATVWLEVRASNDRARALYRRRGFAEVGMRRGYYPAPQGREDAVVMSRRLLAEADGLD
jgi:[ribosomal protein S18]-alanine N-acetyltransferase